MPFCAMLLTFLLSYLTLTSTGCLVLFQTSQYHLLKLATRQERVQIKIVYVVVGVVVVGGVVNSHPRKQNFYFHLRKNNNGVI